MSECHTPTSSGTCFIEAKGRVIRQHTDHVVVMIDPQGCGRCHEPGGCGGQSLTQLSDQSRIYELPNTIGAQVDDRVCLEIEPDLVRKAALSAYLYPLALCFAGALLGQWLSGDLAASVGAVIGLAVGWGAFKWAALNFTNSVNSAISHSTGQSQQSLPRYIRMRFDR